MDSTEETAVSEARRSRWLEKRKAQRGFGASDIARIVSGREYEVYLDKLGLTPPLADNSRMYWGRVHEPNILREYKKQTGHQLVFWAEPVIYQHPDYDWCWCTPDGLVEGQPVGVEAKTADAAEAKEWGVQGTDEIPLKYFAQCQWQLLACSELGLERIDVPVLIGGNDFRIYSVLPSPEAQQQLLERARWLLDRIERREPPPLDPKCPDALDLLKLGMPPREGVRVRPDEEAASFVATLDLCREERVRIEKLEEEIKATLTLRLGDAGEGELPDGTVVRRKVYPIKEQFRAATTGVRLTVVRPRKERE